MHERLLSDIAGAAGTGPALHPRPRILQVGLPLEFPDDTHGMAHGSIPFRDSLDR